MYPPIRNREDVAALEQEPLAHYLEAENVYAAFCRGADIDPDKPAMQVLPAGDPMGEPVTISYRELKERVHQTANMLHALGLGSTDVVSFLLPMCPEAYYTILGGEAAGIVNAVNPLLEPWQIAEILKAANTKILVAPSPIDPAGREIWDKVAAIRHELPNLKAVLQVGGLGSTHGALSFEAEMLQQPGDRLVSGRRIDPADIASYFHTGGTTGTPKLAQHSHHMQASHVWSTGVGLGMDEHDVLLVGLPLFHIGGSVIGAIIPFAKGATLVLGSPAGFRDPNLIRDYWRLVYRYRVTIVAAVPTVLGALLNIPFDNADIGSVRYALTGGAPMPTEVGKAFHERIGRLVIEGYGMTETTSYVTLIPRDGPLRIGSVGVPLPHVEVKCVRLDEDGKIVRECAVDEIGNVVIRGDCVLPGYVQEQYNAGAWAGDGWLNSGDLGRFDEDGYLWITGRAKDLIIRGGHNIHPARIEDLAVTHPQIDKSAAFAVPDERLGERVCLAIIANTAAAPAADDVLRHLFEAGLSKYDMPEYFIALPEFPLTASGKILKRELADWARSGRIAPDPVRFVDPAKQA